MTQSKSDHAYKQSPCSEKSCTARLSPGFIAWSIIAVIAVVVWVAGDF